MHQVTVILAAILLCILADGAQAQGSLAGTVWADDDCMIGYEFEANGRFNEFSIDEDDIHGQWWLDGNVLHFRYNSGFTFETVLEGSQFKLHYTTDNGTSYDCVFTQD
jgi:hypothetical protein